jgi:hypothetical protein
VIARDEELDEWKAEQDAEVAAESHRGLRIRTNTQTHD